MADDSFPADLGERIEDMAFSQLKNADCDSTARTLNRQANFNLFAQVLGALSRLRFPIVSDRFISEVGKGSENMKENKLEMMILAMKHMQLKIYPVDALEETVDFLDTAVNLFRNANGRIKFAYTQVFEELLAPLPAVYAS